LAKTAANTRLDALTIDPSAAATLHRRVYRSILERILSGELAPGSRLPSTRRLSERLEISRNSVMHAFEQLSAEGYLESRVGSGTYVNRELPTFGSRKQRQMRGTEQRKKLTSLVARSGYSIDQIDCEDSEGNAIYLFTASGIR